MSTSLERGILIVVGIVIAFLLIRLFLIIFILLATPEGEIYKNGVTMGNRSDWHGAMTHFDKVIEMNPNNEKAYASRAYARLKTGDLQGAVDDSTKATQMSPYYAQAYAYLGLAELRSGNKSLGCKNLNEAYELGYLEAKYYLNQYCE